MVNPKQGNKGQGGKRGMWIALAALVSAVLVAALGWFLWDQNNGLSLNEAQMNFRTFGIADPWILQEK